MPGKGLYMQFLFIMSFIIYYKNYKHINLFSIWKFLPAHLPLIKQDMNNPKKYTVISIA